MKTFRQYLSEIQDQYDSTIIELIDLYQDSFRGNEKTLLHLKESLNECNDPEQCKTLKESIWQEQNILESIINKAELIKESSINKRLFTVTRWVANRGVDPETHFAPNAEFRHKSILRKIGLENDV